MSLTAGPVRRYSETSGRYRRVPNFVGMLRRPRPDESWQDYARYLEDCSYSSRVIGLVVGKHHTTVLRVINPEFRRDKSRAQKRARALLTPEDRREENCAREIRRAVRAEREARV